MATKYKIEALRRAKRYGEIRQMDARQERINELARQLNEGYKSMITK